MKNSKTNRIQRREEINRWLEPVKEAKDNAVHSFAKFGRQHEKARWLLIAVLFVWLFSYHLLTSIIRELHVEKRLSQVMAVILVFAMVVTSVDLDALAEEDGAGYELTCGQEEHEHSDDCYEKVLTCDQSESEDHTHSDDCYEQEITCGQEEHTHSEDCYTVAEDPEEVIEEETEETDPEELIEEPVEGEETEIEEEAAEDLLSDDEDGEENVPFDQSAEVDGITVAVSAPEGVFPEGAVLSVTPIDSDTDRIDELVEDKENEDTPVNVETVVESSYSFDITVYDRDGNAVEPDTSKGNVSVTFSSAEVADADADDNRELSVYYVTDELDHVSEVDSEVDDDTIYIDAEHFSIYTVVITSGQAKDTILPYYQGTSKENSYFTIYDASQLNAYKNLLDKYTAGTVNDSDTIATLLVNSDDANPVDGITDLGQASDLVIGDLNLSVKIMDDITVTDAWTPISKIPASVNFNGNKHTITFDSISVSVADWNDQSQVLAVLASEIEGTVSALTIKNGGNSCTIDGEGDDLAEHPEKYAIVTVRVDGQKAEIGEAINGAEALAASCDRKHFITLQRSDDHAVYYTSIDNFEEGKDYDVYYVYEDENELLSAASVSTEEKTAELNYVSVTYNLEGANTYGVNDDGTISDNDLEVMSAVRVDKNDGVYEAQEDYLAGVRAVDNYKLPTKTDTVKISVDGAWLTAGTDFTYTYHEAASGEEEYGIIRIDREKITGSLYVEVKADGFVAGSGTTIKLVAKGGTVTDPVWTKTADSTYQLEVFEDYTLPTEVTPLNNSDAIVFAGWYTDIGCTSAEVKEHKYVDGVTSITYYAMWKLARTSNVTDSNTKIVYIYMSNGNFNVQGYPYSNGKGQVTFGNGGFSHKYVVGDLNSSQIAGNAGGTGISMQGSVGRDIFTPISDTGVYVAMVCAIEGELINLTYVFENRGTSAYTGTIHFGECADTDVATDDGATIEDKGNYLTMTARTGTSYPGQQFRLYTSGSDFGIDQMASYWYGSYGSQSSKVFTNQSRQSGVYDSALAFSWDISNIPAGGYVTRTTKIGMTAAESLSQVTATLQANNGTFDDGDTDKTCQSDVGSFTVSSDDTITIKRSDGDITVTAPTRTGYVFDYWSVGSEGGTDATGREFTNNTTLVANWVPKPDRKVINDCSVQKVDGSENLLVPSALANIVINNKTAGVDADKCTIAQGESQTESAGYASGFTGTLTMEGTDDRYLLPDDITVSILDPDTGKVLSTLTKGTGYDYQIWNNKRSADLTIHKQYINGDVKITCTGYELPPVTATSVTVTAGQTTGNYGDRLTFSADAVTSKNHSVNYQWYIAPYYEIKLDGTTYWTYDNQNGEALTNGTYAGTQWTNVSGNPITISGANRSTLRISGLDVNRFESSHGDSSYESTQGLRYGGYHVYCVITSTRNITGQTVTATSNVVESEVAISAYETPDGIEGSATTYYGSSDGTISIESDADRPKMEYRLSTETAWEEVSAAELSQGYIGGLKAGTYVFRYPSDSNHDASAEISVTVANGRYLVVTYRAPGCDSTSSAVQYKHVAYGSTVTASTSGSAADTDIASPVRTGYTFTGWNPEKITDIKEDTTVYAQFSGAVYTITLDDRDASDRGSEAVYEKYAGGFYLDAAAASAYSADNKIIVPVKTGYTFLGYYTGESDGTLVIGADGLLSDAVTASYFTGDTTLYAQWKKNETTISGIPVGITPDEGVTDPVTATMDDDTGEVTVINDTGKPANIIYIYADGVLKETLAPVEFDEENKYTFEFNPDYTADAYTFGVGYTDPTDKTDEEIKEAAEEQISEDDLTYSITYKQVDGSRTGTEFTGTFISAAPTSGVTGQAYGLPEAYRTGYTFAGWYTNARGTGSAVTEISAGHTGDITLYAKWTANKYQITLNTNDGTYTDGYTPAEQYTHDGADVVLPASEQLVNEGYNFMGWYDNENLAGTIYTVVSSAGVGDVTYYASWEELATHTITLTPDSYAGGARYTITPSGEAEAEDNKVTVFDGDSFSFTVTTPSAYTVRSVKANGKLLTESDGKYTISRVDDDITVTVIPVKLTDDTDAEGAEASILLADGTTGYFDTLENAVSYAVKYGSSSEITLLADYEDSLTIDSGHPFKIDLNGHSFDVDNLLIQYGADVSIINRGSTPKSLSITAENDGAFTIGTGITVDSLVNVGIVKNNGTIVSGKQQEAEKYAVSKTVNNGTIEAYTLEAGYIVDGTESGIPDGVKGYTTIMNGNEYYVNFTDAVDIANEADGDSEILILNTVDNLNHTVTVGNAKGNKITLDLNRKDLSSGYLNISGDVALVNGSGSRTEISSVTSEITVGAGGSLEVGQYVKVGGKVDNSGNVTVDEGGTVSGSFTNEEGAEAVNNGTVSGVFTNNGGTLTNEGTMNNVIVNSGTFVNDGTVETSVTVKGGEYVAGGEGASPQSPAGVVAVSDTEPRTYYGTIKDAVDAANNSTDDPFVITLLKDVTDLGGSPVVIETDGSVVINLDGHTLGDDTQTIEIKDGNVTVKNEDESGTQKTSGGVGSNLKIDADGSASLDEGVNTSGDVDNGGTLNNSGTISGNVTTENGGTTENDGTISGNVTNKNGGATENGSDGTITGTVDNKSGGTLTNDGSISGDITNNGDVTNNGDITGTVNQNGGTFDNGEDGTTGTINQTGGVIENEGTITQVTSTGGGYTGNDPVKKDESTVKDDDAVAKITFEDGSVLKFNDLDSALEYAAGQGGGVTVTLTKDLTGVEADLSSTTGSVTLDLNGHSIDSTSTITTEPGTKLVLKDTADPAGSGVAAVVNNKGTLDNHAKITGTVNNSGTVKNESDGTLTELNLLAGGTYTNENADNEPAVTGAAAVVGSQTYADLKTAVEAADRSEGDTTIKLIGDVVLSGDPAVTLENENGKKITLDTNGNKISGGTILISGDAEFTDSKGTGEVDSSVKVGEEGSLTVDETEKVAGNITNNGDISNEGSISGTVDNKGTFDNGGDITGTVDNSGIFDNEGSTGTVNQNGGTFTNETGGTVAALNQNGGTTDNEGTIDSAKVSGGSYSGTDADTMDYSGAKVKITDNEDNTKYYDTLQEALDDSDSGTTITLIGNISDEDITVSTGNVTIDLNGHTIDSESTVKIPDGISGTTIKDSGPAGRGAVDASVVIEAGGDLTIDAGAEVGGDITNHGSLVNSGTISGELTSDGAVKNNGTIAEADITGGTYSGTKPADGSYDPAAKIGDVEYVSLEDAIAAANAEDGDTTIKVLKDTSLPEGSTSVGNAGGNTVTIDLDGNEISGGGLEVAGPGGLTITDSTASDSEDGDGSVSVPVTVDAGQNLVISEGVTVDEDVTNNGTTENSGAILGDVTNGTDGTFNNSGSESYIGGSVTNEGTMTNNGTVAGETENKGTMTNTGNLDNDVTNAGSGSMTNSGTINGQVENKGDAELENSGTVNNIRVSGGNFVNDPDGKVNDLVQSGGSTENNGTITEAKITDDSAGYSGDKPEKGLPGRDYTVTGSTETGTINEYYADFDTAVAAAEEKTPSAVKLTKDLTLDSDTDIPEGVTIDVQNGGKLELGEDTKLTNSGTIMVSEGGVLNFESGMLYNNGGTICYTGTLELKGRFEGSLDNTTHANDCLTVNGITITAEKAGLKYNISTALDETTGALITTVTAGKGTTLKAVKDEDGNVIGYKAVKSSSKDGSDKKDDSEDETDTTGDSSSSEQTSGGQTVSPAEKAPDGGTGTETAKASVDENGSNGSKAGTDNTGTDIGGTTADDDSTAEGVTGTETAKASGSEKTAAGASEGTEDDSAQPQKLEISTIDEAGDETITSSDVEVSLNKGSITINTDIKDGQMDSTVGELCRAVLSEEELASIEDGYSAEIRIRAVPYDNESEVDEAVRETMTKYAESFAEKIDGLSIGRYVEIYIEKNVNNTGWVEVHDLNNEIEITLDIPGELQKDGRAYFVMRYHDGSCILLADTDQDAGTFTFVTDRLSTYAICCTDSMSAEKISGLDLEKINSEVNAEDTAGSFPWYLIALLGLAAILVCAVLLGRRKKSDSSR